LQGSGLGLVACRGMELREDGTRGGVGVDGGEPTVAVNQWLRELGDQQLPGTVPATGVEADR
jgi:hypothetical protein